MAGKYQRIPSPTTAPASIITQDNPGSYELASISPLEDSNTSEYKEPTSKVQQSALKSISATAVPLLDIEKAIPTIRDWPTSPKAVQHSPWLVRSNLLFDILLFACAVAFLAFALIVAHYDKASTANNPRATTMLLNATKYGPSIFPILFALILGRATHAILRWRLERGERIGTLDTLAASTSFTSTIISQIQLRTLSILGVTLVLLWALSPIGGQASIRQMTIGTNTVTSPATFNFLAYSGNIERYTRYGGYTKALLDPIFIGAVTTAVLRPSPLDAWGNVRIPRIEHHEAKAGPDDEGWFDTIEEDLASYASLIGIPISGMDLTGFVDFKTRIQTSYLEVSCSTAEWKHEQTSDHFLSMGFIKYSGPGASIYHEDLRGDLRKGIDPQDTKPFQFVYKTYYTRHIPNNYQLNCTLASTYVEVEIVCPQTTSCAATRVRRSRLGSPPPAWTILDLSNGTYPILFDGFINSPKDYFDLPTILSRYLQDPASVVKLDPGDLYEVSVVTAENYSIHMTQLLNSYYTLLVGINCITKGVHGGNAYYWDNSASFIPPLSPDNDTFFRLPGNISETKAKVWLAEGTKSASTEIIMAHLPWVLTLCIISMVLISASLVSPLSHFFSIRGPEVMMNISSLATRNNPYIPLPGGGTHMGASVRARLLKTVKIRFGDIEDNPKVGHLVIGSLKDADGQNITRVRDKRLYE